MLENVPVDRDEPLHEYEATGREEAYLEAKTIYEHALAESADDADLHIQYGYLLECHARNHEVHAGTGDPDGALADWAHALELDPGNLSGVYSSAFLLERRGRLEEAIKAWHYIIDWSEAHGYQLDAVWPNQELERLRQVAAKATEMPRG